MYQHLKERQRQCKGNDIAAHKSKLSNWITRMRFRYKQGTLSKERIALLDSIGFEWERMETKWMTMYQRLKTYEERNGHAVVPLSYKKDRQLAIWVQTQRKLCEKQDRVDLLNDLGFVWNVADFQSSMANHALERSNKWCPTSYLTRLDSKYFVMESFPNRNGHVDISKKRFEERFEERWQRLIPCGCLKNCLSNPIDRMESDRLDIATWWRCDRELLLRRADWTTPHEVSQEYCIVLCSRKSAHSPKNTHFASMFWHFITAS